MVVKTNLLFPLADLLELADSVLGDLGNRAFVRSSCAGTNQVSGFLLVLFRHGSKSDK